MIEPRRTGGEPREAVTVTLRPASVAKVLAAIIFVLLLLHLASQVLRFGFGYEYQMGFHDRVYLGSELNIPTWFSSSLMLLCGLVLLWIARASALRRRAGTGYWAVLGVIFVGLSMDEAAAVHELLSPIFAGTMVSLGERFGGIFVPLGERGPQYAWVIPGSIAVLVLGLVFLRFLALLPRRSRWLFVLSGVVFLSGALGFEMLGGAYAALHGPSTVGFVALMTIEETLEMAGMALFFYALLRHVETEFGSCRLRLDAPASSRMPRAA
jgi:hypothetical protein